MECTHEQSSSLGKADKKMLPSSSTSWREVKFPFGLGGGGRVGLQAGYRYRMFCKKPGENQEHRTGEAKSKGEQAVRVLTKKLGGGGLRRSRLKRQAGRH